MIEHKLRWHSAALEATDEVVKSHEALAALAAMPLSLGIHLDEVVGSLEHEVATEQEDD